MHRPLSFVSPRIAALLLFLFAVMFTSPRAAHAQEEQQEDEVVANLAAGRVDIIVAKDAIVIGVLEKAVEPNSRPPVIVALGSRRAGVVLGAVDWIDLVSGQSLARLSTELPTLHPNTKAALSPSLKPQTTEGIATDIEVVGLGLFDRLREMVSHLHTRIDLPADEPLVQVFLADYVQDYGPEVWLLTYFAQQNEVREGYLDTRVSRPRYEQLWPPEKGQPKTLIETRYPPDKAASILDLLRQNDPRFQHMRSADPKMAAVATLLLQGESKKILAADALQFLRASLDALAVSGQKEGIAVISEQTGFDWVLKPPEPRVPGEKARPEGAPTLVKP
jgi:hypothetical protein